ncbi:hypothetical protein LAZ67_6000405 [Cordylochernes scorpioides]|uniref:Transposase n=1 Tax=Cordylochernes scorpioides TaxID=51811 RepID=A0ABY6KLI2_9ARAC|nr:hypothetical protein LAZ67_6000405 [Cordylochernes scorpioides]
MWPSNSPDLNPIDYSVWSYLEENVSSSPHKSLESLKKALQREWTKIDVNYLRWTRSKPFYLKVRSNGETIANSNHSQNGFSLRYTQLPCMIW